MASEIAKLSKKENTGLTLQVSPDQESLKFATISLGFGGLQPQSA